MQTPEAEIIAIRALRFVVSDEVLRERFMSLTGLTPDEIHQNAADSGLHLGALEFLLQHEPDAAAFCDAEGLAPGAALAARRAITGEE